jgi:beta-lactamase class A
MLRLLASSVTKVGRTIAFGGLPSAVFRTVSLSCLLLYAPAAPCQTSLQTLLESKLSSRIREYDASLHGVLGVAAIDLATGRVFAYHAEAVFPTASSIKIPILVEMFRSIRRGEFKLTDAITLNPSEAVGGSGLLQKSLANGPVQLTVLDLITAMIENSDNTATNRAIAMAKMERVNRLLDDLGFHAIRLRRVMMDSAAAQRGDENVASPAEMARLAEMLYRGALANPEDTRQMIGILERVKAGMRAAIPAEVEVASKPGDLPGVECETGIVYLPGRPFILSVFGAYLDDSEHPVREVTKAVFDHFSHLADSNEYGHRTK